MALVSFVVIAYNEEQEIERCLRAIEAQSDLGEYEIIVIDDGSTDTTASVVENLAKNNSSIRLFRQLNMGRGAARAKGLLESKGAEVAMVDSDIEIPNHWLKFCREKLSTGLDVVGGVAVPEGDATWIHSTFNLSPRSNPLALEITGNNSLYSRVAIDAIGFDKSLRTAEDIVFKHQLEAAGFSSRCFPELICLHREHKGFIRTLKWMVESGVSATHQLLRFRPLRSADFAAIAWLPFSLVVGLISGYMAGAIAGALWILAISTAHVLRRFELKAELNYLIRLLVASLTNGTLILSYFVGRIVGIFLRNRVPRVVRNERLALDTDVGDVVPFGE